MERHDLHDRREAKRDMLALVSLMLLVLTGGLGLFLLTFDPLAPLFIGEPHQPPKNPLLIIPFLGVFATLFTLGSLGGATLWIVIMSRFLPKRVLVKWLTYGPQIKLLLDLHLRVLDYVYAESDAFPDA